MLSDAGILEKYTVVEIYTHPRVARLHVSVGISKSLLA